MHWQSGVRCHQAWAGADGNLFRGHQGRARTAVTGLQTVSEAWFTAPFPASSTAASATRRAPALGPRADAVSRKGPLGWLDERLAPRVSETPHAD